MTTASMFDGLFHFMLSDSSISSVFVVCLF